MKKGNKIFKISLRRVKRRKSSGKRGSGSPPESDSGIILAGSVFSILASSVYLNSGIERING
jgi:hypothetical protein